MRTKTILKETLVAFKQGARLLGPTATRGPAYGTLVRWAKDGLAAKDSPDSKLVTLEYYYIGGRLFTSVEAFERWLEKIN